MKKVSKRIQRMPGGFSREQLESIRRHYDEPSDAQAAREADEMAALGEGAEAVAVPKELVPVVREMVSVFRGLSKKGRRIA